MGVLKLLQQSEIERLPSLPSSLLLDGRFIWVQRFMGLFTWFLLLAAGPFSIALRVSEGLITVRFNRIGDLYGLKLAGDAHPHKLTWWTRIILFILKIETNSWLLIRMTISMLFHAAELIVFLLLSTHGMRLTIVNAIICRVKHHSSDVFFLLVSLNMDLWRGWDRGVDERLLRWTHGFDYLLGPITVVLFSDA